MAKLLQDSDSENEDDKPDDRPAVKAEPLAETEPEVTKEPSYPEGKDKQSKEAFMTKLLDDSDS